MPFVGSFPQRAADPHAFEKFPLESLTSIPMPRDSKPFAPGKYDLLGIDVEFFEDGGMTLGNRNFSWTATETRLNLVSKNGRALSFYWSWSGNDILLRSPISPISSALKIKEGKTKTVQSALFFQLSSAWYKLSLEELKPAEEDFLKLHDFDDPAISAGLAAIYWSTDRSEKARSEIERLKKKYEQNPDQRAAESLFYAMQGAPFAEIASTASELLQRFSLNSNLWFLLQKYSAAAGDTALAEKAARRTSELRNDPNSKFNVFQRRSKFVVQFKDLLLTCQKSGVTVVLVEYPMRNGANSLMATMTQNVLNEVPQNESGKASSSLDQRPVTSEELLITLVKRDLYLRAGVNKQNGQE